MESLNLSRYLGEWRDLAVVAAHVVVILGLTWLALRVVRKLLGRLRKHMQEDVGDLERVKRLNTLERVFRYVATVIIILAGGMPVLSELGISIAPILATAGVLGIAIGFGAQSLVKDYFTGFFRLLENQVREGDVVEVSGKGGPVEEMTLRYIRLRDYEGSVHYIPNGTVDTVTNRSRGFAFAGSTWAWLTGKRSMLYTRRCGKWPLNCALTPKWPERSSKTWKLPVSTSGPIPPW